MGYIFEASGGFHYRAYSTVDIVTGKPLCTDGQPSPLSTGTARDSCIHRGNSHIIDLYALSPFGL